MDFNEYTPKGFRSWREYRKWQHIADIIGGAVCCLITAVTLYCCGGGV